MQPTRESGAVGKMVDLIVSRYSEIESTLPLLSRELSQLERAALKVVAQHEKVAIGTVGTTLHLPPSTTTWLVGGLVKREIFCRTRDDKDRRRVWIKLTDKGSALARLMERIPDRIAADILYKLDDRQRAEFANLVEVAMKRIEEVGTLK